MSANNANSHEGAHDGFREEEAVIVTSLDPGDFYIGCHTDDTRAVSGSGDGACSMGAVTIDITLCAGCLIGHAADARNAIRKVHIRRKIGMGVIKPGVNVTHDDRRTATRDGARFGRVNLIHIPL